MKAIFLLTLALSAATCYRVVTYDGRGFADHRYWMQLKKTTPSGICAGMSGSDKEGWVVETPLTTPVVAHHFSDRAAAITFAETVCPTGQGDYWWEGVATP